MTTVCLAKEIISPDIDKYSARKIIEEMVTESNIFPIVWVASCFLIEKKNREKFSIVFEDVSIIPKNGHSFEALEKKSFQKNLHCNVL